MSETCIFCRIVAGELPAARVYADAETIAFLDIAPIAKGHTLVIPRAHHAGIMDTPADVMGPVMATVRRVARAQRDALGAAGINVTQANGAAAGQVVPHVHVHVIPRLDDGAARAWTPGAYASDAERDAYAARLRAALNED
jgi:histidine triad (HIT) family protein